MEIQELRSKILKDAKTADSEETIGKSENVQEPATKVQENPFTQN